MFYMKYGRIPLQIFAIHCLLSCSSIGKLWSEHIFSDSLHFFYDVQPETQQHNIIPVFKPPHRELGKRPPCENGLYNSTQPHFNQHLKLFCSSLRKALFPVLTQQCTSLMFLWPKEEISIVRYIIMLKNWFSTHLWVKCSSVRVLKAIKWMKKWFHLGYFNTLQQQKTSLDQSVLLSSTFAI